MEVVPFLHGPHPGPPCPDCPPSAECLRRESTAIDSAFTRMPRAQAIHDGRGHGDRPVLASAIVADPNAGLFRAGDTDPSANFGTGERCHGFGVRALLAGDPAATRRDASVGIAGAWRTSPPRDASTGAATQAAEAGGRDGTAARLSRTGVT